MGSEHGRPVQPPQCGPSFNRDGMPYNPNAQSASIPPDAATEKWDGRTVRIVDARPDPRAALLAAIYSYGRNRARSEHEDIISVYIEPDFSALLDAALAEAREEQKQVDATAMDIACDRNYAAGVQAGWNFGQADDHAGMVASVQGRWREIRDAVPDMNRGEA